MASNDYTLDAELPGSTDTSVDEQTRRDAALALASAVVRYHTSRRRKEGWDSHRNRFYKSLADVLMMTGILQDEPEGYPYNWAQPNERYRR